MSLEDKLDAWRDATDGLVASARLKARLHELQTSPPSPRPSNWVTVTSIGVVSVVVAVVAVAWFFPKRVPDLSVSSSEVSLPLARDAGTCAPRVSAAALGPVLALPFPNDSRVNLALARRRPMTCDGQLEPNREIIWNASLPSKDRARARARLLKLCGAERAAFAWVSWRDFECDDSAWCRAPACERVDEGCAEALVAQPARSCARAAGLSSRIDHQCRAFVEGRTDEDTVRNAVTDLRAQLEREFGRAVPLTDALWCLDPAAVDELRRLDGGAP